MKSHVHNTDGYTDIFTGILLDACAYLGTPTIEAERDKRQFLSLIKHRGMGFLTLTLPNVGKIFDRSLSDGRLPKITEPGFGKVTKGSVIPVLMRAWWIRVFDQDGIVLDNPCIRTIASLRQVFYCLKKARLPCDPERITSTYASFIAVDEALPDPTLNWDRTDGIADDRVHIHLDDVYVHSPGVPEIMDCDCADHDPRRLQGGLATLQFICDVVATDFGFFDPEEWSPRHGRGAVSDLTLGKAYKYAFPTWSEKLETVFPYSLYGFANVGLWADAVHHGEMIPSSDEVSSRLITVPKDMKGPRLIASEPTCNQYCQQAILAYLNDGVDRSRTLKSLINFRDQEFSRSIALESSLTGEHATIDLSHASDSVSCWLVERMFRRNDSLLRALMASRTSSTEILGTIFPLKKFSTMGAATTFPVQTIFYASVCLASECIALDLCKQEDILSYIRSGLSTSRVFGDDIAVPGYAAKYVISLLTKLGFEVNQTKTFTKGNFRESCGMDAYMGVDVTPTYVLDLYDVVRPSTFASVMECANNLHLAGWWNAAKALESTVPRSLLAEMPVVAPMSGGHGRVSFCGNAYSHLRSRWNADLHITEYRTVSVKNDAGSIPTDGSACLLQYFEEAPNPDIMDRLRGNLAAEPPPSWGVGYGKRPSLRLRRGWAPS